MYLQMSVLNWIILSPMYRQQEVKSMVANRLWTSLLLPCHKISQSSSRTLAATLCLLLCHCAVVAATDFVGEAGTFVFFGVKFLQVVMYQKLLKLVDFLQSY